VRANGVVARVCARWLGIAGLVAGGMLVAHHDEFGPVAFGIGLVLFGENYR
jgi:hypothetical protein